uniref:uncharacterized protein LOC117601733 n=1 Tax=Osmia lignaria TaxID=473952 RepID=UPI0014792EC4|nr:uncharacterized protein LOC117601733 [Osmia lignaria]
MDNEANVPAESNRPISIRDAADIVPPFDGHNISVYQFTKNCLNARGMISPNAEYGLVQLIKNKLCGQALRVVLSGDYNTIEQLITVLKSRFAPLYSSIQLCGDMSKLAQMPNEAVVDYSSRVSSILLQIQNCNEIEVPEYTQQYNASAEANAVKAFLTGMKPEIFSRIRNCEFNTLDEAISAAIKGEAEYKENMMRMKLTEGYTQAIQCSNCFGSQWIQPNRVPQNQTPVNQRQNTGQRQGTGQPPAFQHPANQPLANLTFQPPVNQPPSNWYQGTANWRRQPPICAYCQNIGHTIEQCRKKAYQEKIKNQPQQPTTQEPQVRKETNLCLKANYAEKPPSIKLIRYIEVKALDTESVFHVVEDLPIAHDGILGTEFFKNSGANIDYAKSMLIVNNYIIPFQEPLITIPSRTRTTIPIKVENTEEKTGFIPKIEIHPQLYMGNAVVTNRTGIAFLHATNVSSEDIKIQMPTLQLEPYEEIKIKEEEEAPSDSTERITTLFASLRLEHLNREEKSSIRNLISNNADRFYLNEDELGATNKIFHRIITIDEVPVNIKQYRYPQALKEEVNRQVKELLDKDIIEHSSSPYNSPIWIVPKKEITQGNKSWRLVIDFRKLNEKTISDAYSLPNIVDILDQLGSAKYFSIFDLMSSFHQIPMHPDDKHKTAFSRPFGHFHFKRMPFGLKNAAGSFQRLMNNVLVGLQGVEAFVYIDDIVIYASSIEEHETKFNRLMARLREANLYLQPEKCELLKKEVAYLGHIITEDGVKPDPKKVEAVKEFPVPKTGKNIRQFLGLCGYYRRFIKNFSKIAKPLSDLTKKEQKFEWTQQQQQAFIILRDKLCEEPILQYPDFTKPFNITTDASGIAVGAVLSQGEIGKDQPVSYTSRVLNEAETQYSATERELLAVVYAVTHFRPYIYGRKFYLITDHKPLTWLHNLTDPASRLMRWKLKLSEYDYEIKYKPGRQNINADALSRNPIATLPIQAKRKHSTTDSKEIKKKKQWHQYATRPRATTSTTESREIKKKKQWHQYQTRPRSTTSTTGSKKITKRKKEWHQYPTRPRPSTTTDSREHKKKKETHQYPTRPRPSTTSDSREYKRKKETHQHPTRRRPTTSSSSREIKKKKETHQYPTRRRDTSSELNRKTKRKKQSHQHTTRQRDTSSESERSIVRRKTTHPTRQLDTFSDSEREIKKEKITQHYKRPHETSSSLHQTNKKRFKENITSSESEYCDTDEFQDQQLRKRKKETSSSANKQFKKRRQNEKQVTVEIHQPPKKLIYEPPKPIKRKHEPIIIGDEIEVFEEGMTLPKHIYRDPPKIGSSSGTKKASSETERTSSEIKKASSGTKKTSLETKEEFSELKKEEKNDSESTSTAPITPIKIIKEEDQLTTHKITQPRVISNLPVTSKIIETTDHLQ